jgi:hypothetical protein
MFVHHKGGSPDCELYFSRVANGQDTNRYSAPPQGQTFKSFIADVDKDFERVLMASNLVSDGVTDDKLVRLIFAIVTGKLGELRPNFELIEANAKALLFDCDQSRKTRELAPEILEYYERSSARFVDGIFCKWLLYCISLRATEADLPFILNMLAKEIDLFSRLAGVALSGLILFYSNADLRGFCNRFNLLVEGCIQSELERRRDRKEPQKRSVTISPATRNASRWLPGGNLEKSKVRNAAVKVGVASTEIQKSVDMRYVIISKMPNCRYCGAQTDASISHLFTCSYCGKTNFV